MLKTKNNSTAYKSSALQRLYITLILFGYFFNAAGQNLINTLNPYVGLSVGGSTAGQLPFWLRSNQYGTVPVVGPYGSFQAGFQSKLRPFITSKTYPTKADSLEKIRGKVLWEAGGQAILNLQKEARFLLPEAYMAVRWRALELYGGRRREVIGLVDTTLTTGSYIWSGNALPMPIIQLAVPEYSSIIGKGLISLKGSFAHGWFENGLVKNFFLHRKTLYGRLGRDTWKVRFYGGFNHQVQWGGRPPEPYVEAETGRLITHYPRSLKYFMNVATGISLNREGQGLMEEGVPINEAWNRSGNHLGTVDIGLDANLGKNWNMLLYRQSIYDDGSLFYLNNITDGLTGLSFKRIGRSYSNVALHGLGVEYLSTLSQGGKTGSEYTIPHLRGQDNYFNNTIYRDSWTYHERTIGTPLLAPISTISSQLLYIPTSLSKNYILSNRLSAINLTNHLSVNSINFITRISLVKYLGSYALTFKELNSIHTSLLLSYKRNNVNYYASISNDTKNPYTLVPNTGVILGGRLHLR